MKHTLLIVIFTLTLQQSLEAQTTAIPDTVFEKALITLGYDTGTPDGIVLTSNISNIDSLDFTAPPLSASSGFITDLTGIEGFSSLVYLNCSFQNIHTVDFSQNTALKYLFFRENIIFSSGNADSLDFSGNPNLEILDLFSGTYHSIKSINLTQNFSLTTLDVSFNSLVTLDLSQNTSLVSVFCFENLLTSISLNSNIKVLECGRNKLTQLDVSNLPNLTLLTCWDNQLTCLNVKNGNFTGFPVDASQNPNLTCVETDNPNSGMIMTAPSVPLSTNCGNACSSGTVSVADLTAKQSSVFVYPNPITGDRIMINCATTQSVIDISLTNTIGQNIYKATYDNTNLITIPVNNIPKGIYFLTIQTNAGILQVEKIVKN